jgi:PhnB protein
LIFIRRRFGAQEKVRAMAPDGKKVMHAEVRIGDSVIFLSDEFPGSKGPSPDQSSVTLQIYVEDADDLFNLGTIHA